MYDAFSEDIFRQIVQHELVHYHLYREGRGYKHGDRDFKALLSQVVALCFAPLLTGCSKLQVSLFDLWSNLSQTSAHRFKKIQMWQMSW